MVQEIRAVYEAAPEENLARIRLLTDTGALDDALAACRAVVRDFPSSAAGHALMGDVYTAQGDWTEAVEWYERALHLNFDPGVMEKLAAARSQVVRVATAPIAATPVTRPPVRPAEPSVRADRAQSQMLIGLVVAGVLVVSMLIFWIARPAHRNPPSPVAPESARVAAGPAAGGAVSSPGQPATSASLGASSAALQTGPATSDTQTPGGYGEGAGGGRPAARTAPVAPVFSSREQHMAEAVHGLTRTSAGRTHPAAASMAFDDYSGLGILSIRASLSDNLSAVEQSFMVMAFRAAIDAMRADPSLRTLVVRCVAKVPNEQGEQEDVIIFRTTLTRDALKDWIDRGEMPTLDQMRSGLMTGMSWDQAAVARYLQGRSAEGRGQ